MTDSSEVKIPLRRTVTDFLYSFLTDTVTPDELWKKSRRQQWAESLADQLLDMMSADVTFGTAWICAEVRDALGLPPSSKCSRYLEAIAALRAEPQDREPVGLSLRDRILWQNGSTCGDDDDEYERVTAAADKKIRWAHAADFGAPVRVVWANGTEDYGVLTTLPGFSEPDMDGVIHVPHPWAEKGEDDSIWITLNDCAALDDVLEIHVGLAPPADTEGEEEAFSYRCEDHADTGEGT